MSSETGATRAQGSSLRSVLPTADSSPENLAISLREVNKFYRLFKSNRDRVMEALHPLRRTYHRPFFALDGINLNVPRGTTLGVMGRNGSGKSTLLKVIRGILKPSSGTVIVNGLATLLELGSGFNPEFTGRENIILSGVMIGRTRQKTHELLPQIESFAEIGDFIDQPVKTYSTGMFMRLAFAWGVHVDPDILMVDEVLAVGDAKFQRKCFRKLEEFQAAGKTIILVSHSRESITRHCDRAILLEQGRLAADGDPNEVANRYDEFLYGQKPALNDDPVPNADQGSDLPGLDLSMSPALREFVAETPDQDAVPTRNGYNPNEHRFGSGSAEILDYLFVCGDQTYPHVVSSGQWADLYVKVRYHKDVSVPDFGLVVKTVDGLIIHGKGSFVSGIRLAPARAGEIRVFKARLRLALSSGPHFIDLGLVDFTGGEYVPLDVRYDVIHFLVAQRQRFAGLVDLEMELQEFSSLCGATSIDASERHDQSQGQKPFQSLSTPARWAR